MKERPASHPGRSRLPLGPHGTHIARSAEALAQAIKRAEAGE